MEVRKMMIENELPGDGGNEVDVLNEEYLSPKSAYNILEGMRSGFNIAALGLGAANKISTTASLITAMTVEGFCTAVAIPLFIAEVINVTVANCTGLSNQADHSFIGGRGVYLSLRAACIFASSLGVALVSTDIPTVASTSNSTGIQNNNELSIAGFTLMGVSIFASRLINNTMYKPKPKDKMKNTDDSEIKVVHGQKGPG